MSADSTRWWWIRHAPVPDPEGRIHGRMDLPCDTSDAEDIRNLANMLPRGAVLVESGLLRCMQTAQALAETGIALPPPVIVEDFVEQDFGRWQGKGWGQLASAKDPDLADFWLDPAGKAPPGGESFASMVERVKGAIARLNAEYQGRDIVSVSHAGTIRAALAVALELAPETALRFDIKPLSLTRLEHFEDAWGINGVNQLSFL